MVLHVFSAGNNDLEMQ